MIKIAIHHTGGKQRGFLGTPDNSIELFPWIAKIVAIKINDMEFSAAVDHHVPNVIVAVLINLRSSIQQMTIVLRTLFITIKIISMQI